MNNTILFTKTIKEGLSQLSSCGKKTLYVVNENNELYGSLTDGDVRRWILKTGNVQGYVKDVCHTQFSSFPIDADRNAIKETMLRKGISSVPLVDENNHIVDQVLIEDFVTDTAVSEFKQLSLPVVIMAGGKGTRLDPFTRILPKPLIPIGDKPMLEIITDEYAKHGMTKFYISVNHKAKMIKAYFEDHTSNYSIEYIEEEKPLGTGGSLKFLQGRFKTPFFVSNCDILIKGSYAEIYEFHKKKHFDLTMVAALQHHTVPYGVCEIENGGTLKRLNEKPEYSFLVNTGMYIMNPETIEYIPANEFFHITDLMEILKCNGLQVGVFPVSKDAYIDVGQWDQYKKAVNKLK
jgi:dTDP-glucose pyrophosphorylase